MNEIELLEQFRADVPEPSTDAWLRARAALAAAKKEALSDDRCVVPASPLHRPHRRPVRWRTAGVAAGVGASIAVVLGLVLAGPLATTPTRGPGMRPTPGSGAAGRVGFVLTADANGTLTLTMSQMLDPTALQQALVQHGVPALVETATYCTSNPPAPDPFAIGVLTTNPPLSPTAPEALAPAGSRDGAQATGPNATSPGNSTTTPALGADTTTVIDPAAMPAGTELFFDYAPGDNLVAPNLIDPKAYTCAAGSPPVGPKG